MGQFLFGGSCHTGGGRYPGLIFILIFLMFCGILETYMEAKKKPTSVKTTAKRGKKIFVGMSGGVDSSVAALLLVEAGYDVVGVFMQNWSSDFGGCCNLERDVADARSVANQLGIPFYVWNFEREYRDKVLDYFYSEYEAGRTPNPDVMCNREIKFKLFLDRALKLGADYIATGHYAQVTNKDGIYHLLKGVDPAKDQSYFLCLLGQKELSHALFPLGAMTKTEVRAIAKEHKLLNATKKDSQGLCFVGQVDIREFLKERLKPKIGKIINVDGKILGEHEGVAFYTLGQRKEIGNLPGGPYYVVDKKLASNELVVSSNPSEPLLWKKECLIDNLGWVNQEIKLPNNYEVIIRYHHKPVDAHLTKVGDDKIKVVFAEAQRAVTPGQLAVICVGEELLGAGVIL